ncbi:AIDA repeat-containing protein, partial [Escherichia coli]|uniref:AIDA repeat-containing protein n=1 Tax=Escherichia coli TaxID=562 RepID=UPI001484EA59
PPPPPPLLLPPPFSAAGPAGGTARFIPWPRGGPLYASGGALVEGTIYWGKVMLGAVSGQDSGWLLEKVGGFTVNTGGQAGKTTVGHRGTLTLAAGGTLSGRT